MIENIGVIGAGQMGSGIAHVCVLAGYEVFLSDVSKEALEKGVAAIDHNMERQVARNKLSVQEKEEALKRLHTFTGLEGFKKCDLVIEAVTENEEIKKTTFKKLSPFLSSQCILATNTSSIPITVLGEATDRPDKFMGMHFMNPVPIMQLVELIRGMETSNTTFNSVQEVVKRIGKQFTVSEDYPGFIVNRILMPMINEAVYALFEGVGSVEAIDKGMRLGTNQPMGPLELADFIGLDTCAFIMNVLYEGRGESKYKPCPLLIKYVEAGWLGRKTDRGFYDYKGEHPVPTR
ncbi:MAG: 3-hydroxybutyryl-CoA dehydrogenase [Alphaproteobacteria bacterium 41-28]|nr:MAG: 3-hydroxybutyryl-CoA dehydrogenase [Alphaproteobacteria bacterium 41-28]